MSDRGSRPGRGAQKTITNTTTPGATRRDIHVDTKSPSK
ncbi:Tat pathway signal sequence, partial [Leptospira kmetyi]